MSVVNSVLEVSKMVSQTRNETSVMLHVMEEVGELALELAIYNGTSYKPAGSDGVIGEAVDSIICLIDLIYCHNTEITEEELQVIFTKKTQKWIDKTSKGI